MVEYGLVEEPAKLDVRVPAREPDNRRAGRIVRAMYRGLSTTRIAGQNDDATRAG